MLLILFIDLVISSIIGLLTKDLYPQSNESEDEEENGRNWEGDAPIKPHWIICLLYLGSYEEDVCSYRSLLIMVNQELWTLEEPSISISKVLNISLNLYIKCTPLSI